jgi:hypothetical protein
VGIVAIQGSDVSVADVRRNTFSMFIVYSPTMTLDDMIKKSEECLHTSKKLCYSAPDESICEALNANYWVLRAIFEKLNERW